MKKKLCRGVLISVVALSFVYASKPQDQRPQIQQATVLKVEKQEVRSPDTCCYSGSDTPLQTEYFAYDVSVRVGCATYDGRYETPFDYFPSAFAVGHAVQVRMTKHVMYFEVPGDRDLRIPITHRRVERNASCRT